MGLFALVLLSFFVLHAQGQSFSDQVANNFTQILKAQARINWDTPPYTETTFHDRRCGFFTFHPFSRILRRQLRRSAYEMIDVQQDVIPQKRFLNLNHKSTPIRQDDALWVIQGDSDTWHAAATMKLGKVDISGGTVNSHFDQTMQISGRNLEESCPGGHACHFEDWVYYAKWTGVCRTQVLNRKGDICQDVGAKQFEAKRSSCKGGRRNSLMLCKSRLKCAFRLPIRDVSGKPLSTTVFIKESHIPPPVAIAVDKNCIFRLNNNRWYDSDYDIFWTRYDLYDDGTQRWVLRGEDEPVPLVPDNLLGNCTLPPEGNIGKRDLMRSSSKGSRPVTVKIVGGFGYSESDY
ncbi:hypothetical protein XA68_11768 [Ophiocordyceps unilateralis]|uniref:Uncharacterized protein n=1 Tax=Ophiocordyceps unilateralis TaxID=268505 RepID=A0A2A9PET2_OPHUN|nr:hypothetical protein XA68_11768 [Ophiocordyceps unilateralis]